MYDDLTSTTQEFQIARDILYILYYESTTAIQNQCVRPTDNASINDRAGGLYQCSGDVKMMA